MVDLWCWGLSSDEVIGLPAAVLCRLYADSFTLVRHWIRLPAAVLCRLYADSVSGTCYIRVQVKVSSGMAGNETWPLRWLSQLRWKRVPYLKARNRSTGIPTVAK